jgi:nicotinamidase-related amidase
MLGGIGHALVSSVEEAVFFFGIARSVKPDFQVKGQHPLTEKYSVLSPEVLTGTSGKKIADKNTELIRKILDHDAVIIAGQAKSHCVAWTIDDLLSEIKARNQPDLARKIYLLEDCTSPVVIPEVVDYTNEANEAFQRFADAGMNLVRSTEPVCDWRGLC